MPVIKALPSPKIIKGLRGVLDFYCWKGLNCVRSWPHIPLANRSPASMQSATLFGLIVQGYSLLGGALKTLFIEDAADQPRTGRDLYVSAVLGHLHETTMSDLTDLLSQATAYLKALADVANALNSIGTDQLIVLPGHDGANPKALLVDGNQHAQIDVLSSALPTDAATAPHQITQNTALALIEKLEHALATVHTDELRTRPGENAAGYQSLLLDDEGHLQVDILDLPDPFDVANLRSAGYIRFGSFLLGLKTTLTKHFTLMGDKTTGILDNTPFDILEFNSAAIPSTWESGLCTGWLTLLVRNRHTDGYAQGKSHVYFITVLPDANGMVITLHQNSLGTHQEHHAAPITVTLSSTGATTQYLKLQAKFTHASWDNRFPTAAWQFVAYSHAIAIDGFITPSIC